MDNEEEQLNGVENDEPGGNQDNNFVYVVKGPYISQEDILKVFDYGFNERNLEIRNIALEIIAKENDKYLLSDVTVIIQDSESTIRNELKHGTGQERLFIYVGREGTCKLSWENKSLIRKLKDPWVKKGIVGVCCCAGCIGTVYYFRGQICEYANQVCHTDNTIALTTFEERVLKAVKVVTTICETVTMFKNCFVNCLPGK